MFTKFVFSSPNTSTVKQPTKCLSLFQKAAATLRFKKTKPAAGVASTKTDLEQLWHGPERPADVELLEILTHEQARPRRVGDQRHASGYVGIRRQIHVLDRVELEVFLGELVGDVRLVEADGEEERLWRCGGCGGYTNVLLRFLLVILRSDILLGVKNR